MVVENVIKPSRVGRLNRMGRLKLFKREHNFQALLLWKIGSNKVGLSGFQ